MTTGIEKAEPEVPAKIADRPVEPDVIVDDPFRNERVDMIAAFQKKDPEHVYLFETKDVDDQTLETKRYELVKINGKVVKHMGEPLCRVRRDVWERRLALQHEASVQPMERTVAGQSLSVRQSLRQRPVRKSPDQP